MCPTPDYWYYKGRCYYFEDAAADTGETLANNCPGSGATLPKDLTMEDNLFIRSKANNLTEVCEIFIFVIFVVELTYPPSE